MAFTNLNKYIEYSKEVSDALQNNKPVVAIETGGTFAGIPYPDNVQTARKVSEEVRKAGAVPAYISIMKGKIKVGMSDEELDDYGKCRGAEVTMDISSDLEEIAVRNVIVVCSGAKSILDLNLTMKELYLLQKNTVRYFSR